MLTRCLEISTKLKKEALQKDGEWHDYGVGHIDQHYRIPSSSHEMSSIGKAWRDAKQTSRTYAASGNCTNGFFFVILYKLNDVCAMCSL